MLFFLKEIHLFLLGLEKGLEGDGTGVHWVGEGMRRFGDGVGGGFFGLILF